MNEFDGFAALGIHGAMALIIFSQVVLMIRAIDLIRKHVVPLASNHFTHIETAYQKMNQQLELNESAIKAHTEAIFNNTAMIKSQGELLREMIHNDRQN